MSRGRKPQPAELKRAKGNPGKRAIPSAAEPLAGAAIRPLAKMRPAARSVWNELAPGLERLNFLRQTDRFAFGRYCEAVARWWQLNELLRKLGGEVYETDSLHGKMLRLRPEFLAMMRYEKTCTDLEDRFGLSPGARQSIMLRSTQLQPLLPFGGQKSASPTPPEAPDSAIGLLGETPRNVH